MGNKEHLSAMKMKSILKCKHCQIQNLLPGPGPWDLSVLNVFELAESTFERKAAVV